jgi:dienelactone hydrolase
VVACPDVFRGQPWALEKFPPKPADDFIGWVSTQGSWDIVKGDLHSTIEHLKATRAVKSFGTLGFCWGGCMALRAGADVQISAVGCVHAAFFGQEKTIAEQSQAPVIMLPAKGDPMEALKEVFDEKPYAAKCVYRRFDDQTHGFCAARGDWTKPEVAAAATEAIDLLSAFFDKNL